MQRRRRRRARQWRCCCVRAAAPQQQRQVPVRGCPAPRRARAQCRPRRVCACRRKPVGARTAQTLAAARRSARRQPQRRRRSAGVWQGHSACAARGQSMSASASAASSPSGSSTPQASAVLAAKAPTAATRAPPAPPGAPNDRRASAASPWGASSALTRAQLPASAIAAGSKRGAQQRQVAARAPRAAPRPRPPPVRPGPTERRPRPLMAPPARPAHRYRACPQLLRHNPRGGLRTRSVEATQSRRKN